MIILLLIIALAIGLFYVILNALDIPGAWKFVLVFIEMAIVGQVLIRRYRLPSELGLILLKSKKGIRMIEGLAKRKHTFNFFSDVGNSLAYGMLSLVMMKKRSSAAAFVTGLFLLAVISFFVAPTAFVLLFEVLKLGAVDRTISSLLESVGFGLPLVSLILLVGGLFLFILFGIVFYGCVVLHGIIQHLFFGVETLSEMSPGGTFLLPGVNLPLFEGLIALVVVMVAHEGAHAVLARIGKVPLLSSGIVLFGIIPVGAFVEPDERKLAKLDDVRQTRVLAAGSTSNFITSCIFFLAFVAFALLAGGFVQNEYSWTASLGGFALDFVISPFKFIYITLGLTFALNFIVGAVNLLPLPLFDGYRIVEVNVKNRHMVKALMYVTLLFFILNFLPWFFQP